MNEEVQTINLANEIAEEVKRRALKIENSDKDFVQLKREDTIDIQYLAAASFEKQLIVYNLNTSINLGIKLLDEQYIKFKGAIQSITDVEFSPFDDCILAASEDQMARIWSLKDGRLKLTLTGHSSRVGAARFIEGGNRIRLLLQNFLYTIIMQRLMPHIRLRVSNIQLDDRLSFASGHTDNNLKFWDSRSSECVKSMDDVHSMPIAGAFASIDGKYLLTTSKDNTIKLVDPRKFQVIHSFSHERYNVSFNHVKPALRQLFHL
ncbi:WD40 repeat-like protein [Rozella allomycis CSF55]|uniref:WD40 repeat-like protein n=1 Tax=Rozella allomycis (strain CSF55) TaxID=988480 RepID=A0A4P9YEE2_ROZAC|nr:WD40 repeat-like protein [Rozella allomycis CSF55]